MRTIEWDDGRVKMIDQQRLPQEYVILEYSDYRGVADAIKTMKIRGAPAIGAAAAFGEENHGSGGHFGDSRAGNRAGVFTTDAQIPHRPNRILYLKPDQSPWREWQLQGCEAAAI